MTLDELERLPEYRSLNSKNQARMRQELLTPETIPEPPGVGPAEVLLEAAKVIGTPFQMASSGLLGAGRVLTGDLKGAAQGIQNKETLGEVAGKEVAIATDSPYLGGLTEQVVEYPIGMGVGGILGKLVQYGKSVNVENLPRPIHAEADFMQYPSTVKTNPGLGILTEKVIEQPKVVRDTIKYGEELTRLRETLNVTKSPAKVKLLQKRIGFLEKKFQKASVAAPLVKAEPALTPEAQKAEAILTDFKTRMAMANEGDDVALGLAPREAWSTMAPSKSGDVGNSVKSMAYEFLSPETVMSRDPFLKRLFKMSQVSKVKRDAFVEGERNLLSQVNRIVPGSPEDLQVATWLDRFETLPANVKATATDDQIRLFDFMRAKYREAAELVNRAQPGSLPPVRQIKNYIFRLHDPDVIVQGWMDDLAMIKHQLDEPGLTLTQKGNLQTTAQRIEKSLQAWQKKGTLLYDYMPNNVKAAFLEARTASDAPEGLSALKAYDAYMQLVGKKVFFEPLLKHAHVNLPNVLDRSLSEYGKWYVKDFFGLNTYNRAAQSFARGVTGLNYLQGLGFNLRSAVQNSTQRLNTLVEVPTHSAQGQAFMLTPEFKRLFEKSLHFKDVATRSDEFVTGQKAFRTVEDMAGWVFNRVEQGNRAHAFSSAYLKGRELGSSIPQISNLMKKGYSLEDAALSYADDIVSKVQFDYGITGMPKITRNAAGKMAFQFGTFSIKQAELLAKWAQQNPGKLMSYLLATEGLKEGGEELFGIDLSNAIGIGVDFGELIKASVNIARGNRDVGQAQLRESLGGGILPGGLFAALKTAKKIYDNGASEAIPTGVQRMIELAQAHLNGGPVVDLQTGRAKVNLSPQEKLKSLLIRTSKEKQEQDVFTHERALADQRAVIKQALQKSIGTDGFEEPMQRAIKYLSQIQEADPTITINSWINEEILKRKATPSQYKIITQPTKSILRERVFTE